MASKSLRQEFFKGVWDENPIFRQLLGMCPTLAVTNAVINGLAMGLATAFVLIFSSIVVAAIKKLIPSQVRIASYIVVIATFVTMADRFLAAFFPPISKSLGPYVPLIVVNCIILGRQEAFSSKNSVGRAFIDALGMSTGFIIALLILSSIREILGSGTWLGHQVLGSWFEPWIIMILPPGAFLTLGILLGLIMVIDRKLQRSV
ncbi:MAG: electron transport complex subunit RsxE [Candidatus Aminicenantes bacterium]|nr:MAG: electron transport complex subunit RsxE [Candidatus Aminicenantes bacterium]RLE04633.1 MAG: electron transport complex subunit RsxE [Candidatus Aminicenantes bacterium]HHF43247.1 electron transport complex subunit E [Candidatus Aminicenantes bacterium]